MADWAVRCARGLESIAPPDFVMSAGDLICGESDFDEDFRSLRSRVIEPLDVPLLPCLGNHENREGEGIPDQNAAYDRAFGPRWHNYYFTVGGLAFVVVDSSGGHRLPDDVTAGYPPDFAAFDVYLDRIEVTMHRAPRALWGDVLEGDIHGPNRHPIAFTDVDHPDHECCLSAEDVVQRILSK